MKAQSAFKTLVIPASRSIPVAITGSSFYLKSATGFVDCNFDDGATLRLESGNTLECPPGDYFSEIVFTNPDTSASITITYYAGTLSIGTRTPYVFSRYAQTYAIGKKYAGIAAAADTLIDTTNLRAGKVVADSRNYIILQTVMSVATDTVFVNTVAGGATPGLVLTGNSLLQRFDTPATLYVRGNVVSGTVDVYTISFFNYDS